MSILSVADSEYTAKRLVDGKLVPQTYVVMKGSFVEGLVRDRSLEKATFAEVVRMLAPGLARQEFYPAKGFKEADLLLVIHWGAMSANVHDNVLKNSAEIQQLAAQYQELQVASATGSGAAAEPGMLALDNRWMDVGHTLNFALAEDEHERLRHEMDLQSAAVVLGLARELRKSNASLADTPEAQDLRAMLEEDRYFINVSAFDARELIASKKLKRVWSAKLSIRSPGVSFRMAAQRIGAVGGQFFGTNQDGLKTQPAKIPKGSVEIKEPIILEW